MRAALAERLPTQNYTPEFNEQLRHRNDTVTWLAETLYGSMRNRFEFSYDGQDFRAEDNGSLNEIFDDAVTEARLMAEQNPSLLFELRRRLIEKDELNDMTAMVPGRACYGRGRSC